MPHALRPLVLLLLTPGIPPAQEAALHLAAPFSDHMVLQAGRPVPLWGSATPGAEVGARMDGHEATTRADAQGRWRLELPAPGPTADPFAVHAIEVRSGAAQQAISDVLVGEVWLASGQSNMEWPVRSSNTADELAGLGRLEGLRMFTVERASLPAPATDVVGAWQVFERDTVPAFSAVGAHFALALYEALDVPIGIVHSSWGGSSVEAWLSAEALAATAPGRDALAAWREARAGSEDHHAEYPQPELTGAAAEGWAACDLPVDFEALVPGFDGVIWFRREVVLPAAWKGPAALLALGAIDDADEVWLDGVPLGATHDWQAPRRYAIEGAAARTLDDGRAVLAVRVEDTGGWGGFRAAADEIVLESRAGESLALARGWSWKRGARAGPPANHRPAQLSNGMLQPLVGLPLRGVIWYQGESNAGDPAGYEALFPALIEDWRARLGPADLPFYWVQLASFRPGGGDWPGLREAQRQTLTLPRTGMAVTIDVGDPTDIHPRDKRSVGERLARWALFDTYGRDVVPSGPLAREAVRAGDGALVRFAFDAGLTARTGGALRGFELAGADGVFHAAQAQAVPGGVRVRADGVPEPRQVRYAWADDPSGPEMGANLVNGQGLPASPFRLEVGG